MPYKDPKIAKEKRRAYSKLPETQEKRRAYTALPHVKEKRQRYNKLPHVRERLKSIKRTDYHAYNSMKRYGLTLEENAALGTICAICGVECVGPNRHIDHDHKCCPTKNTCGKCIRGILCNKHNMMLGLAKDDLVALLSAIKYLEKYASPRTKST